MSFTPAHARCSSHTSSARSSTYGIQPIWPSLYASLMDGWRTSTPENRKSLIDDIALPKLNVAATAGGASADVNGICDDDPMCMQISVSVSAHASKNGSQYPECSVGSPSLAGISENATACTPRAALWRTSAAASSTSHSGTMHSGISRPPESPHHSSTIQSLYARTHAQPRSRSVVASVNVCPQNRGNVGKQSEASTQFISMSSMRAFGS